MEKRSLNPREEGIWVSQRRLELYVRSQCKEVVIDVKNVWVPQRRELGDGKGLRMKEGLGFCEDGSGYSGLGVRAVGRGLDLKKGAWFSGGSGC